jgi:hypothetical protein
MYSQRFVGVGKSVHGCFMILMFIMRGGWMIGFGRRIVAFQSIPNAMGECWDDSYVILLEIYEQTVCM